MLIRKDIFRLLSCLFLVTAFAITLPVKSTLQFGKQKQEFSKKTEKKSSDKKQQNETFVKAATPETTLSSTSFNLYQAVSFTFSIEFPRIISVLGKAYDEPLFLISYFENTFCHHIAINAP